MIAPLPTALLALLTLVSSPVWPRISAVSVAAAEDTPPAGTDLRPSEVCPEDPERLVAGLLHDLPSYANLVAGRSLGRPSARPGPFGTVLVASTPDFEPIDLSDRAYGAGLDQTSTLRQVFFTTLERQYLQDQAVSLQNYHWLFLVKEADGWRLALLYSSLGSYPAGPRPTTPPQESSDGIIGQAIMLWLRDCRAGAVFPLDAPSKEPLPTER
ncbi:MAG: hypothetical protein ACFCVD_08680 [Nodosilinea sp.]